MENAVLFVYLRLGRCHTPAGLPEFEIRHSVSRFRNPTFSIPILALSINIGLWNIILFGRYMPETKIGSGSQSFELRKTWK